jgi:rhodanese-related sulfurtransferase
MGHQPELRRSATNFEEATTILTIMQNKLFALFLALLPLFSYSWSSPSMFSRIARTSLQQVNRRSTPLFMSSEATKPGVASPEELRDFVKAAGDKLLVVDARNADASAEPGDQKSLAVAPLPSEGVRPNAVNLIWDRETNSMPLPDVDKDTFIITHCGGGGRGQKAKDFLMENGFAKVLNGAGPKETDCWSEFGEL